MLVEPLRQFDRRVAVRRAGVTVSTMMSTVSIFVSAAVSGTATVAIVTSVVGVGIGGRGVRVVVTVAPPPSAVIGRVWGDVFVGGKGDGLGAAVAVGTGSFVAVGAGSFVAGEAYT